MQQLRPHARRLRRAAFRRETPYGMEEKAKEATAGDAEKSSDYGEYFS